ncbi:hypothetical protein LTR08_004362 [Meristemomyces frigidus]|nr:hypothetical protein LTR08_004362 [Meristemomyces frigidus]
MAPKERNNTPVVKAPNAPTRRPSSSQAPKVATRRTSVPNSSDVDGDSDEGIVVAPGRRLVKEVSIPVMAPSSRRKSAVKAESASSTDSTMSSAGSTPGLAYDTPGTTPATSIKGATGLKRKRSSLGKKVLQIDDSDGDESMEDADAALAKRLQEEEYAQADGALNKRAKTNKWQIDDSEDVESELSELESVQSIDVAPLSRRGKKTVGLQEELAKSHKGKKIVLPAPAPNKGKKASLPNRTARANARKSITQTLHTTKIENSESEPEALSELSSEDDFAAEDESEAVSTGVSDTESDALPGAANTAGSSYAAHLNRTKSRSKVGRRGRRFGNHSAADVAAQAEEIEAIVESGMTGRKQRERKKLEKAHPNIKTMWDTLEKVPIIKPVPAEQPASISRKLKQFQLEGLDWLIKQEKSEYKGGLLGDEMGMGKTIQAVSLIMSDYPQKQPTLVVVPPVALMQVQWSTEIKEYTDGKLDVLVYHGQNSKVKGMSVKDLKKFDVIMISYNSLESLYRKETKGWSRGEDIIKEDSPIHAIHFHRLVLDEAHSIKSRTTGIAKACFALTGTYKWCLSGTPVQNRIELLNPLTQSEDPAVRSRAMEKLHMITARLMLRRMKRDYVSSMELPPKEVIVHNEFFGEIERDFSSSIMSNTARQFDTYVAKGVMLNNYANIFGLIMQMRQVANHPDLLLKKHAQEGQNVLVCNICDEVAEEAIRSQCKHDFCRSCVKSYLQSVESTGGDADCPRCHIALAIDLDQPDIEQDEDVVKKSSIINRIKMGDWTSSTKIEMLVYDLYKLRSKKQTLKSIVFSQFTSMLQLIEWRLRRAGFNTVMLDGSMTPIQRQRSIEYFMTNSDVEVFLVSLKAGGVALNLTEASRVFIVDPWWNPAAEWQSADRCHRIGQKRPCVITRLCIEDSVESRMVMLQEKKANMINGTINNDKTSMEKLTPEDMQFLFRGT